MKATPTGGAPRRPSETTRTTVWPDYDATLVLTQKTRRAVRDAVISSREQRSHKLRVMGVALTGFLFLMVLLAPAIWNGFEEVLGGEHIFDLPALVGLLTLMLFPPMLAALIALWKGKQDVEHDRGGFETFRPFDR